MSKIRAVLVAQGCAAMALACVGCSTGWRAGVGLGADTTASVRGEVFVGAHFGIKAGETSSLDVGLDGETSLRSDPVQLAVGADARVEYRHEPRDKGIGWAVGLYDGVHGLFFHGQNALVRAGLAFDILPVISVADDTWRHVGGEIQAGFSSVLSAPDLAQPPTLGDFALRIFYEVAHIGND